MKKWIVTLLIVVAAVTALVAWSILDNTKAALFIEPKQITSEASSTAIDLRGYERLHVLVAITFDSTDTQTLKADIYKASSSDGTYTVSQTATFTGAMNGFLEFEVVKDMDNPYVKVALTPSATTVVSTIGVYYGSTHSPF